MSSERPITPTQRWAQRAIAWYQRLVEGRPSPCRFFPSCSSYAAEAFEVHGTRRGLLLTVRRLSRCRPFGPSGFDPVPVPEPAADRQRSSCADPTCADPTCADPTCEAC